MQAEAGKGKVPGLVHAAREPASPRDGDATDVRQKAWTGVFTAAALRAAPNGSTPSDRPW